MKTFRQALVLSSMVLLTTAAAHAYELNGKEYTLDPFFQQAEKPGKAVTLQAENAPLTEVLKDISNQSGYSLEWRSFDKAPLITIKSKDAPVLHVLAEIARTNQLDLHRLDDKKNEFGLIKDHPILSYAVHGPVLIAWHGKVTSQDFDFSANPPAVVKVTKYRMSLTRDLDATLETYNPGGGGSLHRNRPVHFALAGGIERTLQSTHEPNTFGGPWPDWQFEPVEEFAGKTGDLSVTIPISVSDANHKVTQEETEFVLKDCPL